MSGPLPLNPFAGRVLAAAWRAAEGRGAVGAGSLDLPHALASEAEGEAGQVLATLAPGNRLAEGDPSPADTPAGE